MRNNYVGSTEDFSEMTKCDGGCHILYSIKGKVVVKIILKKTEEKFHLVLTHI